MSEVARKFSLLADSNVKRFYNLTNRRACPDLDAAQVLICNKISMFREAGIRDESNTIIVSCLTNFLTSIPDSGEASPGLRVEPVLLELQQICADWCSQSPDDAFLICPLMYRTSPLWYRDGMSDIMCKFSSVFSWAGRPRNLHLMPSFPSPSLESDGIHLTSQSGLEYLFFLFDSARGVLATSGSTSEDKIDAGSEATRVLEDRVMALEQDHRRLNHSFEMSTAIQAEREDFQENVRNESYFMVTGLPAIKDLRGIDWMNKAISDVESMIRTLLGKDLKVVVVHNASGRREAEVRYSVKMECTAHSQEIRQKFGSFFIGGQDRRPEALRRISISNKVTPGTQIRIMILKLLAKRYLTSNKDGKARVISYEPRPLLKITPPETVTDRRVKSFNYIEAVSKMPTCFTEAELRPIVAKARVHFRNKLRSTFICLDDDFFSSQPSRSTAVVDLAQAPPPDAPSEESEAPEELSAPTPNASRKRGPPESSGNPARQRARR